jgi:hypothetical protein
VVVHFASEEQARRNSDRPEQHFRHDGHDSQQDLHIC